MRKTHTSMKVTNYYSHSFCCGYCDLQNIFRGVAPMYYNAGIYGWNCDLYVDLATDTIISTGYRNTRGKSIDREIIKKYDKKALRILETVKEWEKREKALEKNRRAFIEEITK